MMPGQQLGRIGNWHRWPMGCARRKGGLDGRFGGGNGIGQAAHRAAWHLVIGMVYLGIAVGWIGGWRMGVVSAVVAVLVPGVVMMRGIVRFRLRLLDIGRQAQAELQHVHVMDRDREGERRHRHEGAGQSDARPTPLHASGPPRCCRIFLGRPGAGGYRLRRFATIERAERAACPPPHAGALSA
ncbi:MAG: hypothetical protein MEQ84_06015 [Mesorhizobium sp.]|nr:hypothetical protein [Mesorhizobium sp.]